MFKKTIALVTVVSFLVSLNSCIVRQKVEMGPDKLAGARPVALRVVGIQKKSGEILKFSAKSGATVAGDKVFVPEPGGAAPVDLAWGDIKNLMKDDRGKLTHVEMKDGRVFQVRGLKEQATGAAVREALALSPIPLSEVDLVWISKTNKLASGVATTLASAGIAMVVVVAVVGIALILNPPDPQSCPFVYTFDGEQYVLDAEPYGGSICAGLERTEWISLDNLRPVDGRYKLRLTNEFDEADHTDEFKLVVVDHPKGVAVVADGDRKSVV